MSLPKPHPGLVVRYSYLWHAEHEAGREEGSKDRPCAVILAVADADGRERVTVLPVTHREPVTKELAVEIPAVVKRRLGLDAERSWIVIDEANRFIWPGPDLRRLPGGDQSTVAYGVLPPRLFETVKARFLVAAKARRARMVHRTE